MKKTKIWLIISTSLILTGGIIFTGVMTMLKWDFKRLSTTKFETKTYEITEKYKDILILSKTADVELVATDDSVITVKCYERFNAKHSVTVDDGTILIKEDDTRKWYEHIGVSFENPTITVHVPKNFRSSLGITTFTGNVKIPKDLNFENIEIIGNTGKIECNASAEQSIKASTSTGIISVDNVTTGAVSLSVSTGKITASNISCENSFEADVSTGDCILTDIECKSFASDGNTGSLTMTNVIASEKFTISRSTGDVKFEKCDASEISIETDTGYVRGSLLTDKIFIANSDTGSINVPKTTSGGMCEITTDTGNIKITIE